MIAETFDKVVWSCNHTGQFRRNDRFVLGERIERNLYRLLDALVYLPGAGCVEIDPGQGWKAYSLPVRLD
jgi:hypothetical protein